jgi:pyrroloquinoline quinone (PQQ) biosynthesis protein C
MLFASSVCFGDQLHGEAAMVSHWMRSGALRELTSYPSWLQEIVIDMRDRRERVSKHRFFHQMRDVALSFEAARNFFVRVWPVIEQFPQYMGRNLAKLEYGKPGHDLARAFLTRNVRVEQSHADYWAQWAEASGVSREDLLRGSEAAASAALSHWCWYVCDREPLAAAMAATNYAIEGVTGEWADLVCSSERYAESLPAESRKSGMRWLRAHARYDDAHPWEALEAVATILGADPSEREVAGIRSAIRRSYEYMRYTLEDCLTDEGAREVFETTSQERAA